MAPRIEVGRFFQAKPVKNGRIIYRYRFVLLFFTIMLVQLSSNQNLALPSIAPLAITDVPPPTGTASTSGTAGSSSTQENEHPLPKIVFASVFRNIRSEDPRIFRLFREMIQTITSEYHVILYENDSSDDTRDYIKAFWGDKPDEATLIFEDNVTDAELPNGTDFGNNNLHKTSRIARARNVVLEEAIQHYSHFDYFAMLDLDMICTLDPRTGNYDTDILKYVFRELGDQWDVLSFRQSPYFDWWAFRHPVILPGNLMFNHEKKVKAKNDYSMIQLESLMAQEFEETDFPNGLVEVNSAFALFAIYRMSLVKNGTARYRGYDDEGVTDCEHVAFNTDLRTKMNARIRITPLNYCIPGSLVKNDGSYKPLPRNGTASYKPIPRNLTASSDPEGLWGSTSLAVTRTSPFDGKEPYGPIPHKIWFTHENNILETKKPQHYYDNIMRTINAYKTLWNSSTSIPTEVHFLVNTNCTEYLGMIDPLLRKAFVDEERGDLKTDLCRTAALYLYGGYYFDVDMEVVQPLNLSDKVSFSTSMSGSYPIFFNSFIASTPRHPVLKAALASFYQYYVNRTGFCRQTGEGFENVVGCCTLWDGYQATPVQDRGETFIMQEEHLQHGKYPNLPKRGYKDPDCDFVVHHDASHQVYFYSRIVGSGHCQK